MAVAPPESPSQRPVRARDQSLEGAAEGELEEEKKMAFWALLVKAGYFRMKTSLNKYIELRKGEWCREDGLVSKALAAPP